MNCQYCNEKLIKDEIALCKKLLGRAVNKFMCISCLADYVGCTIDDLEVKIEEFKNQGCTLFIDKK